MWRSTGQKLLASNREQETIIEALLALASSEGGIERQEIINLSDVADAILRTDRPEIDRLRLQVDTAITSAPLAGDSELIERLVSNLFDNAVRHNVAGGNIKLSTDVQAGQAVLSITNTGPVIPPTEIDRLFQPFQRLDARLGGQRNGHGLGLSIVKAIVTAHDAVLAAQAPPSGGLIIDVTFPAPATAEGRRPTTASKTQSPPVSRAPARTSATKWSSSASAALPNSGSSR